MRLSKILPFLFLLVLSNKANAQFKISLDISNAPDSFVLLAYNYFDDVKVQIKDTIMLCDGKGATVFEEQSFGGMYFIHFPSDMERIPLKIDPNDTYTLTADYKDKVSSAHSSNIDQEGLLDYVRLEESFSYLDTKYDDQKKAGVLFSKKSKADFFNIKTESLYEFRAAQLLKMEDNGSLTHYFGGFQALDKWDKTATRFESRDAFLDAFDLKNPKLLLSPHLKTIIDSYLLQYPMFSDSIAVAMDEVMSRVECQDLSYRYILKYLVKVAEKGKILNAPKLYTYLVERYIESNECSAISSKLRTSVRTKKKWINAVQLNEKSPEILLTDTLGDSTSLHSFVSLHDYTFLIFYSPTCSHCKKELPKINKSLNQAEQTYNLSIGRYFVNNGVPDMEVWKGFIDTYELRNHSEHVLMPLRHDVQVAYAAFSNPMVFVLDSKSNVLVRRINIRTYSDFFKSTSKK